METKETIELERKINSMPIGVMKKRWGVLFSKAFRNKISFWEEMEFRKIDTILFN